MSQLLGIPEPMVRIESQGLEDNDDDDNDEFRYSSSSEHPSSQCKSSDSSDDSQTEDLGESIPFSLTPRHSYTVEDEQVGSAEQALELEKEGQEFQEPFYKDLVMSDSLSGSEKPSLTYHIPEHQRSSALQMASTSSCDSHDSFQSSADQHLETEATAPQARPNNPYVGHPQCTTGAEPLMQHKEAIGDREFPSLQPTYNMLREDSRAIREVNKVLKDRNLKLKVKNFVLREVFYRLRVDNTVLMEENVAVIEEYSLLREQYDRLRDENERLRGENDTLSKDNAMVKRMFKNLKKNLEIQTCTVLSLQEQLKTSLSERERETLNLKSLVQQTERRLQLMTQRAMDAEKNMERLKQKFFILQGQPDRSKLENGNLREDRSGGSEAQLKLHLEKPPQAHNRHRLFHQSTSPSRMKVLPVIAEVLESTSKILKL